MKIYNKARNQRGDTIVEVLIVLAVLSLSFSISYATANKGLNKAQNAQEHSQALGYLNSQVELVRNVIAKQNNAVFTSSPFCINESIAPASPSAVVIIDPAHFPTECKKHNDGRYQVSVNYKQDLANPANNYFLFSVNWAGLGDFGNQKEDFTYKMESLTSGGAGGSGISYVGGAITYGGATGGGFYDNVDPPPAAGGGGGTGGGSTTTTTLDWLINGSDYSNCVDGADNTPPVSSSYNGCDKAGNSMFAYRSVLVTYPMTSGTKTGALRTNQDATLTIKYQQYDNAGPVPPAHSLPPNNYKFNITVSNSKAVVPRVRGATTTNVLGSWSLDIERAPAAFSEHTFTQVINIPANSGSTFYIEWTNNAGFTDPNLQINSIQLTQT